MYTPEQREAWIDKQMRLEELKTRKESLDKEISDIRRTIQQQQDQAIIDKTNEMSSIDLQIKNIEEGGEVAIK